MTHARFADVLIHGDRILAAAKLRRLTATEREEAFTDMLINGLVAPWVDWRLIVNGEEYEPKFKTEYAWRKAMKQ